jgi:uncharacterized membrane protein
MKKKIKIPLVLLIILASLLYVYFTGTLKLFGKSLVYSNYHTIQIGKGDALNQEVHIDENTPQTLILPFTDSSFNKSVDVKYQITQGQTNIATGTIQFANYNGNQYIKDYAYKTGYLISLPKGLKGSLNVHLKVIRASGGSEVTLRTGTVLPDQDKLIFNGTKSTDGLAIKILYNSLDWSKILKTIITVIVAIGALILIGNNVVKNFMIVCTALGVMFIFNNPIFEATDEIFHFSKSYDVSLGHLLSTRESDKVGVNLPQNWEDMPRPSQVEINYGMLGGDERYDKAKSEAWKNYRFTNQVKFVEQPTTAVYSPVPYIPQAIGLAISRLIGLKAYGAIVTARFLNLLTYVALTALAIKITPRLKSTLALLGCFPLFVSLAASFSADATLMGLIYLFIAVMFRGLVQNKKQFLGIKDFILPAVLLLFIVLCKFTYWPLSFLLLAFVGRGLFKSKLQGILSFIMVAGLPGLVMVVWNLFIMKYVGTINANEKIDPKGQVQFIIHHPIDSIKAFFTTFESGLTSWFISANQVGWVSHLLSAIVVISLAGLIFTVIFEYVDDEWKLRRYDYVIFGITLLGIVGLVMLSLYLTWSEVSATFVSGLQGRYFLPAIPLILFMINDRINVKQYSEQTPRKSASLACYILLYANLFMIGHFY